MVTFSRLSVCVAPVHALPALSSERPAFCCAFRDPLTRASRLLPARRPPEGHPHLVLWPLPVLSVCIDGGQGTKLAPISARQDRTLTPPMPATPISPLQPQLLELYQRFYLPLEDKLRPVVKALILALLPGLEEETGEFFDKVRLSCA